MVVNDKSPAGAGPLVAAEAWLGGDGCGLGCDDVDEAALLALVLELHDAGDLGIEGVVGTATDVEAGLVRCAALADEDSCRR